MSGDQELFESWFRIADGDKDGVVGGVEAVAFFGRSGLPQATLFQVRENKVGFLRAWVYTWHMHACYDRANPRMAAVGGPRRRKSAARRERFNGGAFPIAPALYPPPVLSLCRPHASSRGWAGMRDISYAC